MYAPVAFRDSSSSFGLWSTLASAGAVFAPPMHALDGPPDLPWVDGSWKFVRVPVLYPSVAEEAGLGDRSSVLQRMDHIIKWLKEH